VLGPVVYQLPYGAPVNLFGQPPYAYDGVPWYRVAGTGGWISTNTLDCGVYPMNKILLAALATVAVIGAAVPVAATVVCDNQGNCSASSPQLPPAPQQPSGPIIVVPPTPSPPPPVETWWIGNWVRCFNDFGDCVVNITVDGLNVRDDNNNVQFAVVNETPVHIVNRNGRQLLVTFSCPLVQTGLWSDTTGVPIMACR
jgi:hypothetical protein